MKLRYLKLSRKVPHKLGGIHEYIMYAKPLTALDFIKTDTIKMFPQIKKRK